MAELRLQGRPASPGFAAGPLCVLAAAGAVARPVGDAEAERLALRGAIDGALADLAGLMAQLSGDAADILGFQIAMLEDDTLSAPAFAAIAAGKPAHLAWEAALAVHIDDYAAAAEEYFQARASDLGDLRDRVLRHLNGVDEAVAVGGTVVAAEDLTPSRFLSIDWSGGGAIALAKGSASSHVAMLARARGVPMVVGLGFDPAALKNSAAALVNGAAGLLVVEPGDGLRRDFDMAAARARALEADAATYLKQPARLPSGEAVTVMINVAGPEELAALDPAICDGIGLVRTEFLFHAAAGLPDEERQYAVYRRILDWAGDRPVTFRTLDAGGDKPIPGLTVDDEANPFLGLRGLRLSLARPEVFRVQLRALCRAAVAGNAKIMLPMVAVPRELEAARGILDTVIAELAQAKIAARRPPLGIMVEVPSAAIAVDRFRADFFSIGSNDLTQYVMAAARDLDSVAELSDAGDPAILRLIAAVADFGRRSGREVSLCGDAGSDPILAAKLLTAGLRALSVAPPAVGRVKAAIARYQPEPELP